MTPVVWLLNRAACAWRDTTGRRAGDAHGRVEEVRRPRPTDRRAHHRGGVMTTVKETASYDWMYAPKRWDKLHAPVDGEWNDPDWLGENVVFACGWRVEKAYIPGVFTRMGAPRCAKCCDKLGLPRGIGSPKNDAECRRLFGLPSIEEERAALEAMQR